MDWKKLLADAGGEAVLRIDEPKELARSESAAKSLGFFCARIDGAAAPDKASLLAALAKALRFPDYFGGNWEALADCLTDLGDWLPASGYLLVFTDSAELCKNKPKDLAVLREVLESAAQAWAKQAPPRPFKTILH